jgi:putative transposase
MPPAKNGTLNCDARSKYMPRLARTVFADVPHHVTQRGNRKENVFFVYNDYRTYLEWLGQYSQEYGVEILAYCLMTNHVHLIVIPRKTDSLEKTFKPLHMRYAQWINRRKGWKGHLWQGRYFSSPLDEHYMWASIRYAELNPVRARMVDRAEDYSWSSAAAHCGRLVIVASCRRELHRIGSDQKKCYQGFALWIRGIYSKAGAVGWEKPSVQATGKTPRSSTAFARWKGVIGKRTL